MLLSQHDNTATLCINLTSLDYFRDNKRNCAHYVVALCRVLLINDAYAASCFHSRFNIVRYAFGRACRNRPETNTIKN